MYLLKKNRERLFERLINAFPKRLADDVISVLQVIPLISATENKEIDNLECLIHPSEYSVLLDSEIITIPGRVYFAEPEIEDEEKLSKKQKNILDCIYLRHSNGYIREKRLKCLADSNEYFILPFTVQLIGEYVIEILSILDAQVNDENIEYYHSFIDENPIFWMKIESQMASYWDRYYRSDYPNIKLYIGRKLINRIRKNKYH